MGFEAIHALIARAIEQHPDRAAMESPRGLLTYAELGVHADDIAVAMQEAGVRPGDFVAVLTPDRAELVTAMLGLLRIGAVSVPLDPNAPAGQLRRAIAAAAPDHALIGTGAGVLAASVFGDAAPSARLVHVAGTFGASGGGGPVPHESGPDDPSHLFFTSGSTGTPKGIVGRLGGIDHFIRWEAELLGAGPGWRVAQLTSPGFDAVLREVFLPLTTGGTLCVPPPDLVLDPAALRRWIDEEAISVLHTVPSLFRRLLDAPPGGTREFSALRAIALSGEKLAVTDARRFLAAFGGRVRLVNLYGPTETTMTKTFHEVVEADLERASIPIGRPLPGTEVLLLDEHGRAVADGEVGEIHIRTPHRSLGYLDAPEATAAAFVPGPAGADDVLYRTGDFGRLGADGLLEYLGRTDHQVKVGGVRVELGGIEAVLREHPAVTDAAVVLADGDVPFLCAYVELTGPATAVELRDHVRDRLPAAAVPAVVTTLPALPRTISGKIDRPALPAPVSDADPGDDGDATPPRTATESAVGRLWCAVLPGSPLDVHVGFFDAGGTSMHVIELLSRFETEFGVALPLWEFLTGPTIESLAKSIEQAMLAAGDDDGDLDLDLDWNGSLR